MPFPFAKVTGPWWRTTLGSGGPGLAGPDGAGGAAPPGTPPGVPGAGAPVALDGEPTPKIATTATEAITPTDEAAQGSEQMAPAGLELVPPPSSGGRGAPAEEGRA